MTTKPTPLQALVCLVAIGVSLQFGHTLGIAGYALAQENPWPSRKAAARRESIRLARESEPEGVDCRDPYEWDADEGSCIREVVVPVDISCDDMMAEPDHVVRLQFRMPYGDAYVVDVPVRKALAMDGMPEFCDGEMGVDEERH